MHIRLGVALILIACADATSWRGGSGRAISQGDSDAGEDGTMDTTEAGPPDADAMAVVLPTALPAGHVFPPRMMFAIPHMMPVLAGMVPRPGPGGMHPFMIRHPYGVWSAFICTDSDLQS